MKRTQDPKQNDLLTTLASPERIVFAVIYVEPQPDGGALLCFAPNDRAFTCPPEIAELVLRNVTGYFEMLAESKRLTAKRNRKKPD